MKVLDSVKTELVVSIDIETVRIEDNFDDLDDEWQSAWEGKHKKEGKNLDNLELADLWQRTASLYGEFAKVCAVSLSYLSPQGELVCKEYYGKDEKQILEAVAVTLHNMKTVNPLYRLVGHASKFFDYPFLSKRYVINELKIPLTLDTTNLKPWEGNNLCTNELWKCGGTGFGASLLALSKALKVPISKVDLEGDEVGRAYFDGEYEKIARYCSYDTVATFNILRKFKFEPIFQFDKVTYIEEYSCKENGIKEQEVELTLLQKLFDSKSFSAENKKEVLVILTKPKLAKKDKEIIFELLKGALSEVDINFGKTTNEQYVNSIINQLKTEISFENN
jgi:hypothetical protein